MHFFKWDIKTCCFAGSERTENYLICEMIAITSHYLWLTVFAWTVVEAYNLYLLFIRILNSHSSKFIFKLGTMHIFAYCFPYFFTLRRLGNRGTSSCSCRSFLLKIRFYKLIYHAIYTLFHENCNWRAPPAIPTLTVPACIVGVTTGLSYDSYSHHEYCLLSGDVVYYAFVCPIGKCVL